MAMKNCILGIIDKLTFSDIRNFLFSLKASNYNGHICLYAGPRIGGHTIRLLKKYNVEVIRFKPPFPFVEHPHEDNVKSMPEPESIYQYRHFLYYDYLLKNGGQFDKVMLTDVRDVVFQGDPFEFDMEEAICVAMETTRLRIADDWVNSDWILLQYGEDVLKQYEFNIISCAGTSFAPVRLMLFYLKEMLREIEVHGAGHCTDQSMHNILLHSGRLHPVKKLFNPDGVVLSLCTCQEFRISNNQVLTVHDKQAKVIHQYDRHKSLIELFNKKYFSGNFMMRWVDRMYFKLFP